MYLIKQSAGAGPPTVVSEFPQNSLFIIQILGFEEFKSQNT